MLNELLFLLLPVAAGSGWYAAKRNLSVNTAKEEEHFARHYLIGLNYLLNEQPDKAVDTFIKMLEIDSDTVETHMALGALFRRRGELDRAIRIHQNLIARPDLPKDQRTQALLALGQDYLRGGLMDRAERLFVELEDVEREPSVIGLTHLLDIYQQQKQWENAIQASHKLHVLGVNVQPRLAHYYCELALVARAQNQLDQVEVYLKKALDQDPNCVRASLLLAEFEVSLDKIESAIQTYKHVTKQDPDYLTEVITPLTGCYEKLGEEKQFVNYLQDCLAEYPRISVVLALAHYTQRHEGESAAAEFILKYIQRSPSIRGLQRFLVLHMNLSEGQHKENLLVFHELITQLLKNRPIYRCVTCGFNGKVMHWLCPSCKQWNTIKPIRGVEGD